MPDSDLPDFSFSSLASFITDAERVVAQGVRLMAAAVPTAAPDQKLKTPPEPFSQRVILCPNCLHGIDPHKGWGEACGVGGCGCMWTPNDIAATLLEAEPSTAAEEPFEETAPHRPWWDAATRWYHTWATEYPERAKVPLAAVLELLSVIAAEPEQRNIPLVEVVSRLVLVIEGAHAGEDQREDENPNHFWNRRAFIARSPITALIAALGSDPYGNGTLALLRVRKTALIWMEMIEGGEL